MTAVVSTLNCVCKPIKYILLYLRLLNQGQESCEEVYGYGNTKSGVYTLHSNNGILVQVFCQFDESSSIGFTFLSRDAIVSNRTFELDVHRMYNATSRFALRLFFKTGTQEQVIIETLPTYAEDLTFRINTHSGFAKPHGDPEFGPYMFVGIPGPDLNDYNLPRTSGFVANGVNHTWECYHTEYHHFVQYSNRFDSPSEYTGGESEAMASWLSDRSAVAGADVIPEVEDFVFNLEAYFGNQSCGLMAFIQKWTQLRGVSIGIPFSKYQS